MIPHSRRDKMTWMLQSPKWRTVLALIQHGRRVGRDPELPLPRRSRRWVYPLPSKVF
jgi:hypothetical protein